MTGGTDLALIKKCLGDHLSSDNTVRIQAELDFTQATKSNPDSLLFILIQIALDDSTDLILRQSSLLHIKRLVPLYWSPAFDKYCGVKTISQDIKSTIRSSLLTLLGDPDSKVRSSSSYAIVQIAAVDYPDEWPNLLDTLYDATVDQTTSTFLKIGSLSVLQEIFDDVVTEDQFFEGGIAVKVLKTCDTILKNEVYGLEVKVETLRLLKSICQYFEVMDMDVKNREQWCDLVIPQIYGLIITISRAVSEDETNVKQMIAWDFKHEIYQIQNKLLNSFSHLLEDFISSSYEVLMHDIFAQKTPYSQLLKTEFTVSDMNSSFTDVAQFYASQRERKEPYPFLTQTLTKEFEFLQTLSQLKNIDNIDEISRLLNLLLEVTTLSVFNIEEQTSDPNLFVTFESGLTAEVTIRDSVRDFLGDLDAADCQMFMKLLIDRLTTIDLTSSTKIHFEAVVFLLTCCFDSDDSIVGGAPFDVDSLMMSVLSIINNEAFYDEEFQFLVARLILMIPRLLFKYIDQCRSMALPSFRQICSIIPKLGGSEDFAIIKSSILISVQYYNYFMRASEFGCDIQSCLISLVAQLESIADEDMNLMLLEVMTILIAIDKQKLSGDKDAMQLVLSIGFKNDTNFALSTSMFECIEDLLDGISQQNFITLISFVFPFLLNKISEFSGDYSSEIDLSLQVLTSLLKNQDDHQITKEVFDETFKTINHFIFICQDDELLQSSSEVLIQLLQFSSNLCVDYIDQATHDSGISIILRNISKFLSPEMSDRAIVRLGDLITLLLKNFESSTNQYFEDILKALTERLVIAKEVPTIENMILIFNMLTISHPQNTIDFLKSFQIDGVSALQKVLPIWFQAYEVMRGYESILSNVYAFTEIYKLEDMGIKQLAVDGNPIPSQVPEGVILTRSMAKQMPIKYEQIPADAKIIKLLLEELKNEMTANAAETATIQHHHEDDDEDDGDGWEDMNDIAGSSFDVLKGYIDDDGEDKRGGDASDDDMKNCLISFFKLCATQNTGNFELIYNQYITEAERNILSEYLVFT